jgi:hypothetical protein
MRQEPGVKVKEIGRQAFIHNFSVAFEGPDEHQYKRCISRRTLVCNNKTGPLSKHATLAAS